MDGKEQREESVILFFSIMMMCDSQRRFVLLALLKFNMEKSIIVSIICDTICLIIVLMLPSGKK